MGLVNGRSDNEFEDEGPVSPVTIARKSLGLDRGQHGTLSDAEQEFSVKYLKSELLRSMKVVLFTAKINILMPCGPVAVLINYLTANHVSLLICTCMSSHCCFIFKHWQIILRAV